jgi:hypothetical protein
MATKRWNTLRLASYGACAGLAYGFYTSLPLWGRGEEFDAQAVGALVGGVAGGAALVALVAALRNLILRER